MPPTFIRSYCVPAFIRTLPELLTPAPFLFTAPLPLMLLRSLAGAVLSAQLL